MTLKDFLDNPIGKGDASINVSLITDALSKKYEASYTDNAIGKKKKIEMKILHQPLKDIYWVVLTIPSETGRGNSYDVVYKLSNPKPGNRLGITISGFDIQVFANSPSFAYTYAYVYNQNNLLIPELSGKLGSIFMKTSPDTRNRNQVVLFDKYVYFGAKYILESKVLNRAIADAKSTKYSPDYLTKHIRSLKTIMDEYRDAEEKTKRKKESEKKGGTNSNRRNTSTSGTGVNVISKKTGMSGVTKNAARKTSVPKRRGTIKKL